MRAESEKWNCWFLRAGVFKFLVGIAKQPPKLYILVNSKAE